MKKFCILIGVAAAESAAVQYSVSDECNMSLQKQALEIEGAIDSNPDYYCANSVRWVFRKLNWECVPNREGIFCRKGGVDVVKQYI